MERDEEARAQEKDPRPGDRGNETAHEPTSDSTVPIPDFVRRALELGFASFFTTEQTIRRAVGETVPKDWVDFVSAQSDRTRKDMTDAIAGEVARSLERIDLVDTLNRLLSGRTIEINAKIRLAQHEGKTSPADTAPDDNTTKGS